MSDSPTLAPALHKKGTHTCEHFKDKTKTAYAEDERADCKSHGCQFYHMYEDADGRLALRKCDEGTQLNMCHVFLKDRDGKYTISALVPGCQLCNNVRHHELFGGEMLFDASFAVLTKHCTCSEKTNERRHDRVASLRKRA